MVLAAWQGGAGGLNPAAAYRRYVEQGLERPPKSPLAGAAHGWLLGGKDFIDRIRREIKDPQFVDEVPRARTLGAVDVESVFGAVTDCFDVDLPILSLRGDGHIARAVAAWLARRLTTATLRELAERMARRMKGRRSRTKQTVHLLTHEALLFRFPKGSRTGASTSTSVSTH